METIHMRNLFETDPDRFSKFSLQLGSGVDDVLLFDYSKNIVTAETMSLLLQLTEDVHLASWIEKMFNGEKINTTENRAVLHLALRNRENRPIIVDGEDVMKGVNKVLERMRKWTESV